MKTQQEIIPTASQVNGFPQRRWKMDIWLLDNNEQEVLANIFSRCVYHLHPTFAKPVRILDECPFTLEEQGWGEFSLVINCFLKEDAGEVELQHELTFQQPSYDTDYIIRVPCHIPLLREMLLKSGTVPVETIPPSNILPNERNDKWMNELVAMDEDVVTTVTAKILRHPAVQSQLQKFNKDEEIVMDTRQLPDELLDEISDYIKEQKG